MDIEKLPKTIELEMFITFKTGGYHAGKISVNDYDASLFSHTECVLLGSKMVTFDVPQGVDIKGRAVENLEEQKSKLQAKHHMEIKEVQDKIDQLLAIEYKPEGEE